MIVAFLDLLGFSNHLEINEEAALDNLNAFNDVIRTRVIDELTHPISEYKKDYPDDVSFHRFVEKSSVTSFEYMISFSDSLVIGSNDIDLFIDQLINFVATVYINFSESFKAPFKDIEKVENVHAMTALSNGTLRYHKAFPVLFRGGISLGDNVRFFREYHINNSQLVQNSLNVSGQTYLKSVSLEKTGKGPRLFCDSSVAKAISNKKIIKKVEEGIYEIVWTIEGCEATEKSSDKWCNVINRINNKMLPAAINLYKHYESDTNLKLHYLELVNLVCYGIIKYANDECDRAEDAINCVNDYLSNKGITFEIKRSVLDDFLA